MDEREFQRMLERFPVVRKKTHARVEWNAIVSVCGNGAEALSLVTLWLYSDAFSIVIKLQADPTRTASSTAPRSTELPRAYTEYQM